MLKHFMGLDLAAFGSFASVLLTEEFEGMVGGACHYKG